MSYRKHKQPSDRQLKVLALMEANPDMKPIEAGRLAGYSEATVRNMKANILDKPLVKSLMDNYRYQLEQHNINPRRLASKLDKLLDASSYHVHKVTGDVTEIPDNKLQLETIKVLHDVYGIKAEKQENNEGLKRRLTLEEYEEKEGVIDQQEEQ